MVRESRKSGIIFSSIFLVLGAQVLYDSNFDLNWAKVFVGTILFLNNLLKSIIIHIEPAFYQKFQVFNVKNYKHWLIFLASFIEIIVLNLGNLF